MQIVRDRSSIFTEKKNVRQRFRRSDNCISVNGFMPYYICLHSKDYSTEIALLLNIPLLTTCTLKRILSDCNFEYTRFLEFQSVFNLRYE